MCGFTGAFYFSDGEVISKNELQSMLSAIVHRGPDSHGTFISEKFLVAHCRLSILDVSEKGHQPMRSKDGNWVVAFNGCIYNFRELRSELVELGHVFISECDTEVLVEGISAFGVDFFRKLNGMFSVAAWNILESKLILARDRYGIKPLYYWYNDRCIVFASEVKGILAHPEFGKPKVDLNALNEYFTFQNILSSKTFFDGVSIFPPGSTATITRECSKMEPQTWWDFNFGGSCRDMDFESCKKETRKLFEQAVDRQLVIDPKLQIGTFLSGGMDSGSITSRASRLTKNLYSFTCGFNMSGVSGREACFDERKDAEELNNCFENRHIQQVLTPSDLRRSLPRLVHHLEDLRLGMSYSNLCIDQTVSKFVKVCLSGAGGDGNRFFMFTLFLDF